MIPKDTLVALYPGTIYNPWEPIFFQSLKNDLILECVDKRYFDAKAFGLSKTVYKSCEARDRIFPGVNSADLSWIEAAKNGYTGLNFCNSECHRIRWFNHRGCIR